MRLSVMVLGDPANSSALRIALRVLDLCVSTGGVLDTLFLYHNGAYAALNPSAEPTMMDSLAHLTRHGLRCIVCRTALTRINPSADPARPFQLGGLADWISASERSDKLLRFGSLRPLKVPHR